LTDTTPSEWYLDLKNGTGGVGSGAPKEGKANCVMKLKSKDFIGMINGTLKVSYGWNKLEIIFCHCLYLIYTCNFVFKPTTAFMTGKLKITGDLSLAMKLEKLLTSLKSKL
jgi:putative sterol carrier protein